MNHPFFLLSLFWIGTAQSAPLPMVERVDAQPLLLLNQRLGEALASLGAPLSTETSNALAALKQEQDDAKITQTMQHLLDPLCVASVEIGSDNALKAAIGSSVEVAEQGWKTFLVKVINHAGAQSHLSVESPNARPIPQGPQEEIAQRWLLLTSHDGRPLDANLSGLALGGQDCNQSAMVGLEASAWFQQ